MDNDTQSASPGTPPELAPAEAPAEDLDSPARARLTELLLGKPKDPHDRRLFHTLSLVPFLAWIGLGADGLSSSAYGPGEAFRALGDHTYLAIPLALLTAVTVVVISSCYMRLIEVFPHGGGGYLVAMKLLGEKWGIVAGSALLVDYVLTITVSVAAAGDALFSLLPGVGPGWKLAFDVAAILTLTVLNLRGVKESIVVLTPIFITFIITHITLITAGCIAHAGDLPVRVSELYGQFHRDAFGASGALPLLGLLGMAKLFLQAYSLGGGTYTGIEAVSNGLAVLRAPKVQTGKRTMVYMAISLSFTAGGLILCYLLADVNHLMRPDQAQTMNAVLAADVLGKCLPGQPVLQNVLLYLTLASEGALLIIAAQAGFIGGPRVMANMAVDSLLPHRFAALSDRFTTSNGIVLMAATSLAALWYTQGNVSKLVLMYSINVFLTFSLAMFGMTVYWWGQKEQDRVRRRRLTLFLTGFVFCSVILLVTVYEKFLDGGYVTIIVTSSLVALCLLVKRYYRSIGRKITQLGKELEAVKEANAVPPAFDPSLPTAGILVNAFGPLGIHTLLKVIQSFPGYFRNFHFISVGTIDLGNFKGLEEMEALEKSTEENLRKFVRLAEGLGLPATCSFSIGTDAITELERLCRKTARCYRTIVFFSGKLLFEREKWYHFLFHNQTAYALQKKLQWAGLMMVILPMRLFASLRPLKGAATPSSEDRGPAAGASGGAAPSALSRADERKAGR